MSRAWSRNRRGWSAQSSKSARGDSSAAAATRGSSAATQIAIEPPVFVPTRTTLDTSNLVITWSIADRRSSIQPWSEKSPVLVPQPRNVKVIAGSPTSIAIRSTSCGNVPPDRRASIGPIGNPWHRISPGRSGSATALLDGSLRWLANVNGPLWNVESTGPTSLPLQARGVRWRRRERRVARVYPRLRASASVSGANWMPTPRQAASEISVGQR